MYTKYILDHKSNWNMIYGISNAIFKPMNKAWLLRKRFSLNAK